MSLTEPVRWDKLRKNDWILCPAQGIPEKVTHNRPYTKGRRSVRTSMHDHARPASEKVERFKDSQSLTNWYTDRYSVNRTPDIGEQT